MDAREGPKGPTLAQGNPRSSPARLGRARSLDLPENLNGTGFMSVNDRRQDISAMRHPEWQRAHKQLFAAMLPMPFRMPDLRSALTH